MYDVLNMDTANSFINIYRQSIINRQFKTHFQKKICELTEISKIFRIIFHSLQVYYFKLTLTYKYNHLNLNCQDHDAIISLGIFCKVQYFVLNKLLLKPGSPSVLCKSSSSQN